MPIQLFPNWVVKLVRSPNLQTKYWLHRPVEVFHVSPKMTKFEIKEYLIKLYNLPVSHVHTAIYEGKTKVARKEINSPSGKTVQIQERYREADFKKAYVYLHDAEGAQKPRYHEIEFQMTPEALAAWPAMPHRVVEQPPKKGERGPMPPRSRVAARQKPLSFEGGRPHPHPYPADALD